jgi:hypothetical protein
MTSIILAAALSSSLSVADDAIIGGDVSREHHAVGQIAGYHERYGLAPFCSGTLVRDTWVVTAAHCIDGADEYIRYGMDIIFIVGYTVTTSAGMDDYAYVTDLIPHPDYRMPYHDVGLLELEGAGLPDVDKISLNEDTVLADWVGTDITYVGWGIQNDRGSGSGTKREVDVPIYTYDGGLIITHDPAGERNICSGDSGGAALREDSSTGELELVGVNSFGYMLDGSGEVLCEDPDAAAGVSRVDDSYDWFLSYIGEEEPELEADDGEDSSDGDGDGDMDDMGDEGIGQSFGEARPNSAGGAEASGCSVAGASGGLVLGVFGLVAVGARRRE